MNGSEHTAINSPLRANASSERYYPPEEVKIELSEFASDPYPMLAQMRKLSPICFAPQFNAIVLTRHADIVACERNTDVFSSVQPDGLMVRLMGQNMMRKEGAEHLKERHALLPAISPRQIKAHWISAFHAHASHLLDGVTGNVSAEIVSEYAAPLAAEALKIVTGLTDVGWRDIDRWSQTLIDGISNYSGDKQVELDCLTSIAEIDAAVSRRLLSVKNSNQPDMISVLSKSGMAEENIQYNIRLVISGGQNEPRDAIAGTTWALLRHPDQLALIEQGKQSWSDAFDEYCRFMSPVGMSPRRIAKDCVYREKFLQKGQMCFLMYGSANRDVDCFELPNQFDLRQDCSNSIAFGAGPHFCAGARLARALVSEVALPLFFERFPKARFAEAQKLEFHGWAFRGLLRLTVALSENE